MAYFLPRAFVVLAAWGMTCSLIKNVSPNASATVYEIAGVCWLCAGLAYFGYLRRLRRQISVMGHRRPYTARGGLS